MSQAWMKFYPSDWRADPALRMCSIAARGLWMEMLCLMHEAAPRGSLLINGQSVSAKQLAGLAGVSLREVTALTGELEASAVFSRDDDGTIYSRRMRRDQEKAERDKANGRGGGNPRLNQPDKGGVNPQVKAQIPDTRVQKEQDAADAAPNLERDLFDRGKAVLGQQAGGLIAKLLKSKKNDVALARAAIETASTKQNPREYVGAVISGGLPSGDGKRTTADQEYWGNRIPGIA